MVTPFTEADRTRPLGDTCRHGRRVCIDRDRRIFNEHVGASLRETEARIAAERAEYKRSERRFLVFMVALLALPLVAFVFAALMASHAR